MPSTTECVKIVEYLSKENPVLIQDALKQTEKYEPHYHYLATLSKVFEKFLEKRRIEETFIQGVHISRNGVTERTLFISVVLWLYSPAIYNNNVTFPIENGIRHELEGILLCNESWISQQVDGIRRNYRTNYQEFKDQINDLLSYIKAEVKEKAVEEEQQKPELTLYQ